MDINSKVIRVGDTVTVLNPTDKYYKRFGEVLKIDYTMEGIKMKVKIQTKLLPVKRDYFARELRKGLV